MNSELTRELDIGLKHGKSRKRSNYFKCEVDGYSVKAHTGKQ